MYSISTNHEIGLILCSISHRNSSSMFRQSHADYPFSSENVLLLSKPFIRNLQEFLPVQECNRVSEPIPLVTTPSIFFCPQDNPENVDIPVAKNLRIDVTKAEPIWIADIRLMQRLDHTLNLPK